MKHILVVATGGTIASVPAESGLHPGLTGRELVALVPQAADVGNVDVVQPMNIDSSNMRPSDWLRIARVIEDSYGDYDGFVVMHGTDTMAYTAAALSYLIQGSPKPIVLTGSQQPMAAPFTDAKLNLYDSLLYASDDASSDVCIVFAGKVIAGTRARKQRTMSFNAFVSCNYPELAYVRGRRIVRPAGLSARTSQEPTFYHHLDDRVVALKLTPGFNPASFEVLMPGCSAVVLETFGIGGIPEYADHSFENTVSAWLHSGRKLVLTTQVPEEGLDLGVYEVGRAYANRPGILRGGDMSIEALVAKTMWALGQATDVAEVDRLFYKTVNHDRLE